MSFIFNMYVLNKYFLKKIRISFTNNLLAIKKI